MTLLLLLSPMLPAGVARGGVEPGCSQAAEAELVLRGHLAMVRQLAQGLTTLRYDLKIPERHSQVTLTINNEILPLVAELRKLPPAELRQLCLLADAMLWQGRWARMVAQGDMGMCVVCEEDAIEGYFEEWSRLAHEVEVVLAGERRPAVAAELCRMLVAMGGEQVLQWPQQLADVRLCRDYKTATVFFRDFVAALEQGNSAALTELQPVLDYLLQGGTADRLRVGAMAEQYARVAVLRLLVDREVEGGGFSLSPTTQAALQPLVERLPELRLFLP